MSALMELCSDERLGLPSASGMDRIWQCAGSFVAEGVASQQAVPLPDGSKDAAKGTMLHAANQTGDVSDLDEDDVELVTQVRATEERLVTEWLAETGHEMSDVTIYRELRMWNDHFSGQADMMAVNRKNKSAIVLDLKTGRKRVSAPARNWQMRSLAVLIFTNFDVETIRTAIIQPFAERHAACEYSKEHLDTAAARIKARLEHVRAPGLPRTAGPHCEHCKARHVCPEAKRSMSVVIGAQSLNWNLVTAPEKLNLWKAAVMAEDCAKLIRDQIKADLAADPASVPGLVQAKPQKPVKITDVPALFEKLIGEICGPNNGDEKERLAIAMAFLGAVKISKSDALEFYESHVFGGTKKGAARFLADRCRECITEGFRAGKIDVCDPEPNLSLANRASGEPTTPQAVS